MTKTRKITMTALFAALATIFMMFKFPIAFIAPPFYKLDFSETIVLIAGITLGPVSAIIVELIKVLLNLLIDGSSTAGIGELANFIMGCIFVLPVVIIYRKSRTLKSLVIGCLAGMACLVVGAALMNYFVLIPVYVKAYGVTLEIILAMGSAINASIKDLFTFVVFATVPFNIVKAVSNFILIVILHKPMTSAFEKLGINA